MKKRISQRFTSDIAVLLYIAAVAVAGHLLVSGNYGYFIDEMYTLACSRHLSLAFVDIPPVAPTLLALMTSLFGDSLFAVHILPSLFSGAMVVLVGLMARELGGGKKAVVLAGLCAAFVPVWMTLGTLYTYDFLDQFMVVLLFWAFIRLLKRENPKMWLAIGLIAGVGVMVKPSMLFFIAGIAVALLFTKQRKQYLAPWPWIGAGIAFVMILPALVWQLQNGFPLLQYWKSYTKLQTLETGPLAFLAMQVFAMDIMLLPVWALGLVYFFFHKDGKRFRLLGVMFCVLLVLFMMLNVKVYMPIPLYAMGLAGGAVLLEKFVDAKKARRFLLPVYAVIIALTGIAQAPMDMPILPYDKLLNYSNTVGSAFGFSSVQIIKGQSGGIPLYFTSRFDWDVLAQDVAQVYNSLPDDERADAVIASADYACAGAVDLFGPKLGLPNAVCGRLNYYYYTRDKIHPGTWVVVNVPSFMLYKDFGSVTMVRYSDSKRRMPWRIDIYVCRDPKFTAEEMKKEFRILK